MNRKLIFVSIVVLVCFITACDSKSQSDVVSVSFDKEVRLDNLIEYEIPPVLFKERDLVVTENYLISFGASKDTVFRVFDRVTLDYLGFFGTVGDGPSEFRPIASSFSWVTGDVIHVGNIKDNRLISIVMSDDVKGSISIEEIERTRLPGQLVPWNYSFKMTDNIYVGIKNFLFDSELTVFDTHSKKIEGFIEFPSYVQELPKNAKYSVYQSIVRAVPESDVLVFGYLNFPLIKIFQLKDSSSIDLWFETNYEQSDIRVLDEYNVNMRDLNIYYRDIKVSKKYIYALFQVETGGNFGRESLGPRELHILNLKGTPILKLILEDWNWKYAIDPRDEFLYLWNEEVENKLYKYGLDEIR